MRWALALALFTPGCDRVLGLVRVGPSADASLVDAAAPIDAWSCDRAVTPGNFGVATMVFAMASPPSLTGDQTEMYVEQSGLLRVSLEAGSTWPNPMAVTALDDGNASEIQPALSYNALHIYYAHKPTSGLTVPYESTRTDRGSQAWQPGQPVLFPLDLAGGDVAFGVPNDDGTRVIVSHGQTLHYHLAELVRESTSWTIAPTTEALYPTGSDFSDRHPQLSPDGCWMVFSRLDNAGVNPNHTVMLSVRGASGAFLPAVPLLANGSTGDLQDPWLSPDGATVYFDDGAALYFSQRQ